MHAKKKFACVSNCFANPCKFKYYVGLSWAWHYCFVLEGQGRICSYTGTQMISSLRNVCRKTHKQVTWTYFTVARRLSVRASQRRCWGSPFFSFIFFYQLVANAILFVCVNCIGIFHLWMTEHDRRKSNQKREEFSAIRSRKEIRKYQQVKNKSLRVELKG